MDWLTNTPFPVKERGFLFLIMLPVCAVISCAGGLLTNGYITKTVFRKAIPRQISWLWCSDAELHD